MTGFTAVALDIDPSERTIILAETDMHVSQFAQSVRDLQKTPNKWLNEAQYTKLLEATRAVARSWEEMRDQAPSAMTSDEKAYHFLQLADNAKIARAVLSGIEVHAAQSAEIQTKSAFQRLTLAGSLLVAAFAIVFLITSVGSISIFHSSRSTQNANSDLELANIELKSTQETLTGRSEQRADISDRRIGV